MLANLVPGNKSAEANKQADARRRFQVGGAIANKHGACGVDAQLCANLSDDFGLAAVARERVRAGNVNGVGQGLLGSREGHGVNRMGCETEPGGEGRDRGQQAAGKDLALNLFGLELGDDLGGIGEPFEPIQLGDLRQILGAGGNCFQALAEDRIEGQFAGHGGGGQRRHIRATESGKLVNAFDRCEGGVAVKEDDLGTRPACGKAHGKKNNRA